MELPVLILVNIITAIIIYFFFSLRFSRAVEKARRNTIVRELRENVESAVEFINASLEIIDKKTRTFYELVRRSEELIHRLEELREPGTAAGGPLIVESLSDESSADETFPEGNLKSAGANRTRRSDNFREESASLERVLQRSAKDRLELSPVGRTTDEILESAQLSSSFVQRGDRSGERGDRPGVRGERQSGRGERPIKNLPLRILEGTGHIVGKIFGLRDGQFPESVRYDVSEGEDERTPVAGLPAEPSAPPAGDHPRSFDDLLDRARTETLPERPARVSGKPERPDILDLTGEEKLPQSPEKDTFEVQDRPDIEGAIRSLLESEGLTAFPPAGDLRARLVRSLVGEGYSSEEIAVGSGIALAEVELTASFPPVVSRRRRRRRTEN